MGPLSLLAALCRVYSLCVIARAVFSWLPPKSRQNALYDFLFSLTEPVLSPVRRLLPRSAGIDFSPLLVIIALQFLASALAAG